MSLPFTSPDDVRPEVAAFDPYEPGLAIEDIRRRYGLERVVKMASNENPLGVPPKALAVLREKSHLAFRYPQAGNPRLVAALAAHTGVDASRIFIGNGSDELIDLIFRVRAVPGLHNAVAFRPCFGLYVTQARLAGVDLRRVHLKDDFSFDFDALLERVDNNTSLVFLTSPDNPSGRLAPSREIARVARALPPSCLLVVDEAYIEFAGEQESMLRCNLPNVAVLRTFSKLYGLAGLRIGYGILPPRLADALWRVRLPFSLNTLAEEAALAALEDVEHREATLRLVREGRETLSAGFAGMGFRVAPSSANFIMVSPPAGGPTAKAISAALLERGLIIRTLGGYQLPDWLRISVGTEEENAWLLRECAALLQGART